MSMHEWFEDLWGVELPSKAPTADAALAFCEKHWDVLGDRYGHDPEVKPATPKDAFDFLFDYEGEDECGFGAAIAEVIGAPCICASKDVDCIEYVGIWGSRIFPWDEVPDQLPGKPRDSSRWEG